MPAGSGPPDASVLDASLPDAAVAYDAGIGNTTPVDAGACALAANTYQTDVVNPAGCHVLVRDSSACAASRTALGLSGMWLRFSCRVALSVVGDRVQAVSDDQPDYKSNYFVSSNVCHETYTAAVQNPNLITATTLTVLFPRTPDTVSGPMRGAVVGLALNGVAIFGNFAAPGDDIYQEAQTFDRCGAHPQGQGTYHYHSEPYSLSYDDANLIGVMRDGYAIHGRRDADGSYPSLDAFGGHTSVTAESPVTPVYHYHVNQQTSTGTATAGQKQWFLTTGSWRGSTVACSSCN